MIPDVDQHMPAHYIVAEPTGGIFVYVDNEQMAYDLESRLNNAFVADNQIDDIEDLPYYVGYTTDNDNLEDWLNSVEDDNLTPITMNGDIIGYGLSDNPFTSQLIELINLS